MRKKEFLGVEKVKSEEERLRGRLKDKRGFTCTTIALSSTL